MDAYRIYPEVGSVKLTDTFWSEYLQKVRYTMLPYSLLKFAQAQYFKNFDSVAAHDGEKHLGPPFSDGLILETLRGACDLLAIQREEWLEATVDMIFKQVLAAADEDGFLCTQTQQDYPDKRWGHNDGDIVIQHDLYDHGCLVEAAISHYKATGKTFVLKAAVKAANLIVNTIGPAPKLNIVPGHSLPEEAFVKLYRLFRDDPKLADFAAENGVDREAYLNMAEFWYDARGNHEGRYMCKVLSDFYNQDHLPFAEQREAMGHSVRAMLCYLGAAAVAREKGREDFIPALKALWDNVVYKKLHITGGIGARHDIEGFDVNYNLPNKAYLETCAAIGLAFWNTEMNLIEPDSRYFDGFERSLYNNILSAVGEDFTHFFYQNPLESDGSLRRWTWHGCPCCPPMLFKIYSALHSFIYAYGKEESSLFVNLWLDSALETESFRVSWKAGRIALD
ncbi:MAG: glycoside hydrolase family 127 protein, partial [Clostridia bacterium]|nr:glycoside hydrolase family 127 protein [Clostridia bacterium]